MPLQLRFLPRLLALLLCAGAAAAPAHVVLETKSAEAGSSYKAVLRVGHGCDGAPVTELVVDIPPGVRGAKPMLKPGWRIDIERAPLAQPITSHGKRVTEDVTRVRFSGGRVPEGFYDEFVIVATLPEQAGTVYWKLSQVCDPGRIDWHEVPAPGQAPRELMAPAAALVITPKKAPDHAH